LICVLTGSDGMYEAPLIIGSVVHGVHITYYSHDFERTFENKNEYSKGYPISPDGIYSGHDFADISTTTLNIQGKLHVV